MAAAGNKICLTESLRSAKESQCSERACEGVAVRRGVRAGGVQRARGRSSSALG